MYLFSISSKPGNDGQTRGKVYPRGLTFRYNDVLKELGFGFYQYKIIATIAMTNLSLGIFGGILPFLIPLIKKEITLNQWEVGILISSYGFGSFFGGLIFSYLSDLQGRKLSLAWGLIGWIICSIICTLFDTFYPFLLFRFLAAVGYGGVLPVGVTYLTEYLPDNKRGFYLIMMEIFRSSGGVFTVLIALISKDSWRFFIIAPVSIMALTLLVILILLPESSCYLLYKNRTEEVVKLFNDMSMQNGKNIQVTSWALDEQEHKIEIERRDISIWNDLIIKKWSITVPLIFLWFFPAFGMGVFVFLPEIMLQVGFELTDVYLLSTFLLVLPMIGIFATIFFIDTFGRKRLISLSSLISGLSLLTFLLYPQNSNGILMFYVVLGVFSVFYESIKECNVFIYSRTLFCLYKNNSIRIDECIR